MIRPARAADAAAIAEIWNAVIRESTATFTTALKTETALAALIAERGPAFLVAERAGRLLGFVTYGPFRSGPGYAPSREHTIHLAEGAQGQGVGRALMAAIEAQARREGVHVMVAGVSGENASGIAFHARLGYAEVGRMAQVARKFDRWLDLVLMQKIL